MSKITIKEAKKQYGDVTVIEGLNLEIRDGELFTLLGPSGCGKTTLLRMIAGFNSIEGGDFYFNEERINDKEPSKRNIGMVFQNYAIFPHLTVEKNVAFGLKNRKLPKDEIRRETARFLEMMQIIRGNYGIASAMATVLTVMTFISLLLFNRISKDGDITL